VTGPFDSYPSITIDRVDTYEVPVDPMDDLQCESCQ
jgi:hypothetical protein